MITLIVIFWITCGYLEFGYLYGYFQSEFWSIAERERAADIFVSLLVAFFGPITLLATYLVGHTQHGRLYPWSKDA